MAKAAKYDPKLNNLDEKNPAHVCLYTYMLNYSQSSRAFKNTEQKPGMGPQTMNQLTYYPSASSDVVRQKWASMFSLHVAKYVQDEFTKKRQGDWVNADDIKILTAIGKIVFDQTATVFALASKIDEIYLFPEEETDQSTLATVARAIAVEG